MQCSYSYRGTVVEAIIGDITKLEVDAIVNPANSLMIMGGGVAGAIKRAGGAEIEEEARRYAPVPVGMAIATTAGRLPAKYVIHAPTMERPAMRIGVENVVLATQAALKKARDLGIESIAFPGMGTGVGGVPLDKAAEAMVKTIKEFIDSYPDIKLKRIVLVALREDLYKEFCKAIEKYLKT